MIRFARAFFGIIGIAAATLIAGTADAQLFLRQDQGAFYLGGGVAGAKSRNFCDDGASVGFVGSCDERDTAWKISAGYRFNQYAAVEVGWADLGKASFAGTIGATPFSGSLRTEGFEFVGIGSFPLYQGFSVFGKLGGMRWEQRADVAVAGAFGSGKNDGTDWTWGLGLQYDFTRNVAARAEWQRYKDVDIDPYGVSVLWHFR